MSKKMLTEARAIAAYKNAITGTTIYRYAADYMLVTYSCPWTVGHVHVFFTVNSILH